MNLYTWDKYSSKFQKFKPVYERPVQPTKLEYIYTCEATETFTLKVDAGPVAAATNYAVVPTINDPVPQGWSWSGDSGLGGDGFSCGFDWRVGGFAGIKGKVYDFWYKIKVKKGRRYKLLTHGFSWILVPANFNNFKMKKFHYLWKAVEDY